MGVTIISPENLNHLQPGNVLIENGRIARVERNQNSPKPPGAVDVSGRGRYLIPGLMDSHVHLASIPGMSSDQSKSKQEIPDKRLVFQPNISRKITRPLRMLPVSKAPVASA